MAITTVLFDLDGTLLPMDLNKFIQSYFGALAKWLVPHGYDAKKLIDAIWKGTGAMVKNNGQQTNEQAFWHTMTAVYGPEITEDMHLFDRFYTSEFDKLRTICGYDPMAAQIVHRLKEKGYRLVLATNPVFPAMATQRRIRWTGLQPEDFTLYTTYENSCYCKPSLDYYRSILQQLQIPAEECLMVGNDVAEDMVAKQLGMEVFLLTDCLINPSKEDISRYPNGNSHALYERINALPDLI